MLDFFQTGKYGLSTAAKPQARKLKQKSCIESITTHRRRSSLDNSCGVMQLRSRLIDGSQAPRRKARAGDASLVGLDQPPERLLARKVMPSAVPPAVHSVADAVQD